jgi:hypothetical protein
MPIAYVFRGPHRETRRIKQQPSQTVIETASPVKREAAHNNRHAQLLKKAAERSMFARWLGLIPAIVRWQIVG